MRALEVLGSGGGGPPGITWESDMCEILSKGVHKDLRVLVEKSSMLPCDLEKSAIFGCAARSR
jgi:hypothetical protein